MHSGLWLERGRTRFPFIILRDAYMEQRVQMQQTVCVHIDIAAELVLLLPLVHLKYLIMIVIQLKLDQPLRPR